MSNYIDIWTGFHLSLASWGFILCWRLFKRFYNVLKLSFAVVIAVALCWEALEFVWDAGAYASVQRHLINSFFDLVTAVIACGITAILIGGKE